MFGSPGSLVENNTIWAESGWSDSKHWRDRDINYSTSPAVTIGGINLVDQAPFEGDYRNTVVRNNVSKPVHFLSV